MKFKVKLSHQDNLLHFESEQDETSDQQRGHLLPPRSTPETNSFLGYSSPAVIHYHSGPSVNIGNTTHMHQSPSNRVNSAQSSDSDDTDNKKKKKKPQAIDYAAVAFIFAFLAACSAVIGKYVKDIYDDYSFRLQFKGDRFRIISNILISGILGGLMGIATGLVVSSFVPNIFIVGVGSVLGGILATGCSLIGFNWLTKNTKNDPLHNSKNLNEYLTAYDISLTTDEAELIQKFLIDIMQDIEATSASGAVRDHYSCLRKKELIELLQSLQYNNLRNLEGNKQTLETLISIMARSNTLSQRNALSAVLSKLVAGSKTPVEIPVEPATVIFTQTNSSPAPSALPQPSAPPYSALSAEFNSDHNDQSLRMKNTEIRN